MKQGRIGTPDSDTDSIMYAMSKPFVDIAKPETKEEYWSTIHPQWFVADPNSVDAKTPGWFYFHVLIIEVFIQKYSGYFKNELTMTNGSYCGLRQVLYFRWLKNIVIEIEKAVSDPFKFNHLK